VTTLRGEFGRVLRFLNHLSQGAILVASADMLASTSVGMIARDFPGGYWNASTNADARTLSIGGICEDAMSGFLSDSLRSVITLVSALRMARFSPARAHRRTVARDRRPARWRKPGSGHQALS